MAGRWHDDFPDEPVGIAGSDEARRWRRPWNLYIVAMLSVIGVIMLIGSVTAFGVRTLGGVLVLLAAVALTVSDGPWRPRAGQPPPPRPTKRHELIWAELAVVLTVAGVVLFTL